MSLQVGGFSKVPQPVEGSTHLRVTPGCAQPCPHWLAGFISFILLQVHRRESSGSFSFPCHYSPCCHFHHQHGPTCHCHEGRLLSQLHQCATDLFFPGIWHTQQTLPSRLPCSSRHSAAASLRQQELSQPDGRSQVEHPHLAWSLPSQGWMQVITPER